jgi:hypothetical protein
MFWKKLVVDKSVPAIFLFLTLLLVSGKSGANLMNKVVPNLQTKLEKGQIYKHWILCFCIYFKFYIHTIAVRIKLQRTALHRAKVLKIFHPSEIRTHDRLFRWRRR